MVDGDSDRIYHVLFCSVCGGGGEAVGWRLLLKKRFLAQIPVPVTAAAKRTGHIFVNLRGGRRVSRIWPLIF